MDAVEIASTEVRISVTRLQPGPAFEAEWRGLAARAAAGFFLSWSWIGSWLDRLSEPPLLLRAADAGGTTLGLGLFAVRTVRRHLLRIRQLHLHQTGRPDFDRVSIEHNGLLLDPRIAGHEGRLIEALLRTRRELGWDELVLGGVDQRLVEASARCGFAVETDRLQPHYVVDLDGTESWSSRLSSNARSQLERAARRAEAHGSLVLDVASSPDEASGFLHELERLHTARWLARGKQGGFATDEIWRFHHDLIARGQPLGEVELLRGRAGDAVLGYLYQFRRAGIVSAYQSGIAPADDNRDKPGLILHRMAIERAITMGDRRYDLLAGDARYKRSLGVRAGTLVWCRSQAPAFGLSLERLARRGRARLRKNTSA